MAVKASTNLRPLAKVPGAQFEISIDGTPRTYRDRKEFAIEAAEHLKRKHPNSDIVVKDLQSGEATKINTNPIWGHADTYTNARARASSKTATACVWRGPTRGRRGGR